MNISRYRKFLLFFAGLVIIICILVSIYAVSNENVAYNSDNITYDYKYMLKEQSGQIGVYRVGENTPFNTLDVYVVNLPIVDQYELAVGVYVNDEERLRAIVEDYSS